MSKATATETWPYDARQDDPLTAMRIPVVGTLYPHWAYFVALCVNEDPETMLWHGLRPDDHEAALIQSFIGYQRSGYRAGYVSNTLDARPFDIDAGANTITLVKRGEKDWAFRRDTWQYGPPLVPSTFNGEPALDLPGLLDRITSWGDEPNPRWVEWKAAHPEEWKP